MNCFPDASQPVGPQTRAKSVQPQRLSRGIFIKSGSLEVLVIRSLSPLRNLGQLLCGSSWSAPAGPSGKGGKAFGEAQGSRWSS